MHNAMNRAVKQLSKLNFRICATKFLCLNFLIFLFFIIILMNY
ncbi:hypothetical protein BN891_14840 [Bacteroides xylanisolvens SD CC 2a]|nr:hypothetical protein BN891_14840 [Bacteroides xylanisolvens SD CC 2a]